MMSDSGPSYFTEIIKFSSKTQVDELTYCLDKCLAPVPSPTLSLQNKLCLSMWSLIQETARRRSRSKWMSPNDI